MRKSILGSVCALGALSLCFGMASTALAAPKPAPCHLASSGHYNCSFWPAGNGVSGGSAVVNESGYWVGYLNQGTNWVSCQLYGGRVSYGRYFNHYWAWTEANDHKWGWVNAVWASGGDNDGKFAGVPSCDLQRDVAPSGQKSSGPAPPKPKPKPPAPRPAPSPVPCRASGGHYYCNFYPAGNGLSAGTAVVDTSGYWVGYLNQGSNWITCQLYGGRVNHGPYFNHYWAWTEANNHRWGWVNAVWASGGGNDGKFAGVPSCDLQRDVAPSGQRTSGPTPPRPKPKPPVPKPRNMVVLGDSYSSGEGATLYDKSCFRSHDAYGYLVAHDLGYRLTGFEACGGATTNSVQSYQLGALSSSTTLVTITVGGDDADFIGVVLRCAALGLETACQNIIKKEEGFMRTTLPGRLDTTYSEIHALAPNARVVVLGYPNLWGSCAGKVAGLHYLPAPTAMMDDTLRAAAARHRFTYVDPRHAFIGHSICDKSGWINGLRTHEPWQSFHPNSAGYRAFASLIEGALR
jgi:lysophospholipase L1-like esterase